MMTPELPTVGVAGLGRMGAAIAERLSSCGVSVSVWNRSPEKAQAFADKGVPVLSSPAVLAAKVDFIVTMLTDAEAIETVYMRDEGVLSADLSGKTVIEMSTVTAATEIDLSTKVRKRGGTLVECPVGGTIQTVHAGNLLGLVGGGEEDIARVSSILELLCNRIEHVGPIGAAATVKLAINLPLATYWQSLGEAYALCLELGLSADYLVELFATSSAGPNILKIFPEQISAAFDGEFMEEPPFDCDLLRKDMRTMLAQAEQQGFQLPITKRTLEIYDSASANGWGDRAGFQLGAFWPSTGKSQDIDSS